MNGCHKLLYHEPVNFLAHIHALHADTIKYDNKKPVSAHSEIRFQIWYDDVIHTDEMMA